MHRHNDSCAGFSFLEVTIALSVLVIGLLSLAGALVSGVRLSTYNKETHTASNEARIVMEDFRAQAADDFENVVGNYLSSNNGVTYTATRLTGHQGVPAKIVATAILDETKIQPPVDLNDDGDYSDTNLTPAEVNAVFLQATTTWRSASGPRTVSYGILLSRSEITGKTKIETPAEPAEGEVSQRVTASLTGAWVSGGTLWFSTDNVGEEMTVDALTIDTPASLFVKKYRFDGRWVMNVAGSTNMPATGTEIPMDPFQLELGETIWNRIDFVGSPDGSTPVDVEGVNFTATYHLDNGEIVSVEIPAP